MSALFPDSRPEAEAVLIRLLREVPPWRKLEMLDELNRSVKMLALSGLQTRYPNESPEKLHRRLADLLLGSELAAKAYEPAGYRLLASVRCDLVTPQLAEGGS